MSMFVNLTLMNPYPLLCLAALLRFLPGNCQDTVSTGYGHVLPADFHPTSSVIDSNVDVVVLSDIGHAELIDSPAADFGRARFTRYRKILIRDPKGIKAAKIDISFDPDKNGPGKLSSLLANTYNFKDGKVVGVAVDTADII
jgi:hypothetical protein